MHRFALCLFAAIALSTACSAGGKVVAPKVAPQPSIVQAILPTSSPVAEPSFITFDRTDFRGGFIAETFQIAVTLTNHDTATHDMNVQADFYDVAGSELGDVPAQYFVVMGDTALLVQAGQTATVLINMKDVPQQRIESVIFNAICKDVPRSYRCGKSEPLE